MKRNVSLSIITLRSLHPRHLDSLRGCRDRGAETWIPYVLRQDADVYIRIYDVQGHLVRRLDLSHRAAGQYVRHCDAAHWDGHNDAGEPVTSGVYFYTLQAGDFRSTRKMVLKK